MMINMLLISVICNLLYGSDNVINRMLHTAQSHIKDGFIIEKICSYSKSLLMTKYRREDYCVKILSCDNETLLETKYSTPISLLTGGPTGFVWKESDTSLITHCFRCNDKIHYVWDWDKGNIIDCVLLKNGDLLYYSQYDNTSNYYLNIEYYNDASEFSISRAFSNKSTVSFLEDTFLKLPSCSKINKKKDQSTFLLINADTLHKAAFVLENNKIQIFGNANHLKSNVAAIDSSETKLCLRYQNLFHIWMPKNKTAIMKKITFPSNENGKIKEEVQYFLFGPNDDNLCIFFDTLLQVLPLSQEKVIQAQLPKPFKMAYIFVPENMLVMQSIVDTLYKVNINQSTIEFEQLIPQ